MVEHQYLFTYVYTEKVHTMYNTTDSILKDGDLRVDFFVYTNQTITTMQ